MYERKAEKGRTRACRKTVLVGNLPTESFNSLRSNPLTSDERTVANRAYQCAYGSNRTHCSGTFCKTTIRARLPSSGLLVGSEGFNHCQEEGISLRLGRPSSDNFPVNLVYISNLRWLH